MIRSCHADAELSRLLRWIESFDVSPGVHGPSYRWPHLADYPRFSRTSVAELLAPAAADCQPHGSAYDEPRACARALGDHLAARFA